MRRWNDAANIRGCRSYIIFPTSDSRPPMPELPEVETVRMGLAPVVEGRKIIHVETRRGDLRIPFPNGFASRLTGRQVVRLWRRAKYLLGELDNGETLVVHLGMSGRMSVYTEGTPQKLG